MSFGGGNIGFSDWCQKQACLYRSNGFGGKKDFNLKRLYTIHIKVMTIVSYMTLYGHVNYKRKIFKAFNPKKQIYSSPPLIRSPLTK